MSENTAGPAYQIGATPAGRFGSTPPDGVVIRTEPHACFACGDLNETGLRLLPHLYAGGCWVELAIPERFQGWEGVVHGGIISTILDEVMSWSMVERDRWAVTAR